MKRATPQPPWTINFLNLLCNSWTPGLANRTAQQTCAATQCHVDIEPDFDPPHLRRWPTKNSFMFEIACFNSEFLREARPTRLRGRSPFRNSSLPRLTPAMDLWFHVEPLTSDALRLQARTRDPASASQNFRRKKHAGTIFDPGLRGSELHGMDRCDITKKLHVLLSRDRGLFAQRHATRAPSYLS